MTRYNKNGSISEHTVQKTIREWMDLHGVLYASFANEAANNAITGRRLKERGLRKGASDLMIFEPSRGFHGMLLEVKTIGGVLSQEQMQFFKDVEKKNYFTSACWTIDEGLSILKWYLCK